MGLAGNKISWPLSVSYGVAVLQELGWANDQAVLLDLSRRPSI